MTFLELLLLNSSFQGHRIFVDNKSEKTCLFLHTLPRDALYPGDKSPDHHSTSDCRLHKQIERLFHFVLLSTLQRRVSVKLQI